MGWLLYLFLLLITGALQMALGPCLEIPSARGEYLFLLAFQVALHCSRRGMLPAFFLAGLARDVFLGDRLGAGALAFLLAGVVLWFLRDKVAGHHVLLRAIYVLVALICALTLLPVLEQNWTGWDGLASAGRDALYTALISPVVLLLLRCLPLPDRQPRRW